MRVELTKQECRWLADLVLKEKVKVNRDHEEYPHPALELRRDNMATLKCKLESAIERQTKRERRNRDYGTR